MRLTKKNNLLQLYLLTFFWVIGIIYLYYFSKSTSPYYKYYFGGDSAQFLTVGKGWAEGLVPYRDMFDHKGPYIFFADMLGFKMTGDTVGVLYLQSISMMITLYFIYLISTLYINGTLYNVACTICVLVSMLPNYVDGNTVEEWCLPFLCASTYGMLRYLKNNRNDTHDPWWAMLYGITAGICFLTRITNYMPLCFMLVGIIAVLVWNKKFLNILNNALAYLFGVGLITIPFIIYFSFQKCIDEFLYGTYFYNVEYATKIKDIVGNSSAVYSTQMIYQGYFIAFVIVISSIIEYLKKDYLLCVIFLFSGVFEFVIFTNGASFFQYPLVCIGQVSILVGELATVNTVANDRNRRRACIIAIMAAYFFMIFLYNIFTSIPDLKYYKDTWAENDVFPWIRLVEEVPEHDKNSFVAYGPNEFKDVYLVTGTRCPYKYFVIQEWHALFSEKVSNEISYIYENGDAKWILLSGGSSHIDKALNERYFVYDSLEGYTLYRLK